MYVYAYQPRRYDPPVFVAEDLDELEGRLGELLGGPQCDNCGNSVYHLERKGHGSRRPIYGVSAVCTEDPDDEVSRQFGGCGRGYPVSLWDADEVVF